MSQDNQSSRRVGDRLRQVREQQGISVADAAERLHILPSYVNAMETGRYGVLPGTVFLRGYVRSYARMLRLNEDEIVAQLDRELGSNEEQQAQQRQAAVHVKQKKGHRNLLLALLIGIAILIGAVVYTQRQDGETANTPAGEGATVDSAGEPPVVSEPAFEPESMRPATPDSGTIPMPEPPPASVETDVAPTPQAEQTPAAETDASRQEAASTSETAAPESTVSEPAAPDSAPSVDETLAPEPGETDTASTGEDRLVVKFTGDCWFELTDADGERKRGLFRSGDTLVYEGQAPFKVVVGAASETQMVFNGIPVDYSQYRVWNNRVGLTLGQ